MLAYFFPAFLILSCSWMVHCKPADPPAAAAAALSTSLSDLLSSIFENVMHIPWQVLSSLRSLLAVSVAKGSAVLGDVSKGVGVTITSAADVFDVAKRGTQSVGQGFNNLGDYVKTLGSTASGIVEEKKPE